VAGRERHAGQRDQAKVFLIDTHDLRRGGVGVRSPLDDEWQRGGE